RAADRLFECRNPAQARTKRASVEECAEALGAKPAVKLRSGVTVAAGVAYKDVKGVAARHGGSLFAFTTWSIPSVPDSCSNPAAISSCSSRSSTSLPKSLSKALVHKSAACGMGRSLE